MNFFPPYQAVNFVGKELLDADPGLATLLAKLDGAIDETKMATMNAQVDIDAMNATEIAY